MANANFFEAAAQANAKQLCTISVTLEKYTYFTLPRLECDYNFRLGGLESQLERLRLDTDKLQKAIELKCENQSLSKAEAMSQAEAFYAKRESAVQHRREEYLTSLKMLQLPLPTENEINRACEIMENIIYKMDPLFSKVPAGFAKKLEQAHTDFKNVNIPALALLDAATDDTHPVFTDAPREYARIYGEEINKKIAALKQMQSRHPFDKTPLMTSPEKLDARRADLTREIRTLKNYLSNLEKQFSSLF